MVLQGKRKFRTKSLGNAAERRERRIVLYAIMRESNLSALQAARTLSAITQIIAGSLQKGGMVQVRHWGTFYVRAKPARVVKLNGAVIEAPRKKQVLSLIHI